MTPRNLLFVAPLPPPLHGFSEISRRMLERLQERCHITIFDTSPKKWLLLRLLFALVKFFASAATGRGCSLYLAFSGGSRQLLDLPFLVLAHLARAQTVVHHHSFAYLNAQPWYSTMSLFFARRARHVVLCDRMGELLSANYLIPDQNVISISNSAFIESSSGLPPRDGKAAEIRLGFLSNITTEKGIFDFFDLVEQLTERRVSVTGVIAGPVDSTILKQFESRIAGCEAISYRGPVYDGAKRSFYSDIDLLIFPTRYRNEAEPVTILESLMHGVPVIATSKGCIPRMLPPSSGWVIGGHRTFSVEAAKIIEARGADFASFGTKTCPALRI